MSVLLAHNETKGLLQIERLSGVTNELIDRLHEEAGGRRERCWMNVLIALLDADHLYHESVRRRLSSRLGDLPHHSKGLFKGQAHPAYPNSLPASGSP